MSFFGKLKDRLVKASSKITDGIEAIARGRAIDADAVEELEELLIQADLGVETATAASAAVAKGRYGKKIEPAELLRLLADEVASILGPVAEALPMRAEKPQIILVVGVNGSGKTTTIGKLAAQFKAQGQSVFIAAADTFRAAAIDQLKVWGERADVPVIAKEVGSDPAGVAFDALEQARAADADIVMIDTAGRLQNRKDLMAELEKIVRVIRKFDASAPHDTLLVLDATVGQNAISQADAFRSAADVTGLIMTKLDGTAKGGILVALAQKHALPIHAIGVGEGIDDLQPFDPQDFANALTGAEAA